MSSYLLGGSLAKVCSSAKFGIHVVLFGGGSISQSRFVCQVWCSGIQSSILDSVGGPLAKVGSSANFGVLVFKASILNSLGGPSAKAGSSANSGVLVFKASLVYFPRGFIGQR